VEGRVDRPDLAEKGFSRLPPVAGPGWHGF